MERGDAVEQLGPVKLHKLLKALDYNAVTVHLNRNQVGLVEVKRLQSAQKAGRFDKHGIAWIYKYPGYEIYPLHGAGRYQHVLPPAVKPKRGKHMADIRVYQRSIALGGPVLEQGGTLLLEKAIRQLTHRFHGEGFLRGITAAKGDYFRIAKQLEQLPDRAAGYFIGSVGKCCHDISSLYRFLYNLVYSFAHFTASI